MANKLNERQRQRAEIGDFVLGPSDEATIVGSDLGVDPSHGHIVAVELNQLLSGAHFFVRLQVLVVRGLGDDGLRICLAVVGGQGDAALVAKLLHRVGDQAAQKHQGAIPRNQAEN